MGSVTSSVHIGKHRKPSENLRCDRKISDTVSENIRCFPLAVVIMTTANRRHPMFSRRHRMFSDHTLMFSDLYYVYRTRINSFITNAIIWYSDNTALVLIKLT